MYLLAFLAVCDFLCTLPMQILTVCVCAAVRALDRKMFKSFLSSQ